MIIKDKYKEIKEKYGHYASWAIWADEDISSIKRMSDLSIFDVESNRELLSMLNPSIVFVGLNISGKTPEIFSNFHSTYNDSKIRDAFKNTRFYGGYITDIIKNFEESDSEKTTKFLKNKENKEFVKENIKNFQQELDDLGGASIELVSFGNAVYDILHKNGFTEKYKVMKVPHYSVTYTKEKYINTIRQILNIRSN
jgi:hypothetical protein